MKGQHPQQLALFEITSERQKDGSFIVIPRRVVDNQRSDDVGVTWAHEELRLPKKQIRFLCQIGELVAWKMPGRKGSNAKYRIARNSVLTYKARQQAALLD